MKLPHSISNNRTSSLPPCLFLPLFSNLNPISFFLPLFVSFFFYDITCFYSSCLRSLHDKPECVIEHLQWAERNFIYRFTSEKGRERMRNYTHVFLHSVECVSISLYIQCFTTNTIYKCTVANIVHHVWYASLGSVKMFCLFIPAFPALSLFGFTYTLSRALLSILLAT